MKKNNWIAIGIFVSLAVAALFTSFYGVFENEAREYINNPLESEENISYLYENCYMLYYDLYNRQNPGNNGVSEIFLESKDGYEWLLEEETRGLSEYEFLSKLTGSTDSEWDEGVHWIYSQYSDMLQQMDSWLFRLEENFGQLNSTYDYLIEDTVTDEKITNMTDLNINFEEQFIYLTFVFDENGNVSLDNVIRGNDVTKLRKSATAAMRNGDLKELLGNYEADLSEYLGISGPKNCRVSFSISNLDWQKMKYNGIYAYEMLEVYYDTMVTDWYDAYYYTPCYNVFLFSILLVILAGVFWPAFTATRPWNTEKLCRNMPIEVLLILAYLAAEMGAGSSLRLASWVNGGSIDSFAVFMPRTLAVYIVYGINILALSVFLFVAWYVGICLKAAREQRMKDYIKERSCIYRIFPYVKKKYLEVYAELEHFDVTQNAKKLICKVVIINGIVLFIIGCFPLGGLAVAVVYSFILYFVLKKYISGLQKKYGLLLRVTNEIAEGNLNTEINENWGVFEPFKPQVIRIQQGFKKAVDEEIKSQRMKSELITNVSHDLKTPLTAIITYINLLKEESVTEEQRREYLDTLERKSLRLKVLIEDLFEVSKASSNNMTLDIVDVDIVNLIKQVTFEMSDKLQEKNLDLRMELPTEKVIYPLDSQKTYRIFENLFGNVAKYALSDTRVYIQCINSDKEISIIMKNISAQEIQVSTEELTERFVRGDMSRNTEGSGLGLAIAKSFTEIQGGSFEINVDGDLFKVTITFTKQI